MKYLSLWGLSVLSLILLGCGQDDIEIGETLNNGFEYQNTEIEADQNRSPASLTKNNNHAVIDNNPISPGRNHCIINSHQQNLEPHFFRNQCKKANKNQLTQVNQGNLKKDQFLSRCYQETHQSCWCDQLIRPNPQSLSTFQCTYGKNQIHQLIHPDEDTWKYAIESVKIVKELERKSLFTEVIYNWWRPEPYNKNVGGSATRHPFGTSVDVRFKTKSIQNKAFNELCKMRRAGRIRAIGYYSSTAIHFGIGDRRANTWGKNCP